MSSTWYNSDNINPVHIDLPVRQVYVWFITKDNKIALTGNGKGKYQFPGGKPEPGETQQETMRRELFEEVGIKLNEFTEQPQMFGYYLVEDDPNWPDTPKYLQLRYYMFVDKLSTTIELSVNERIDDKDQMLEAKFVDLQSLPESIPWTEGLPEYEDLKQIRQKAQPV